MPPRRSALLYDEADALSVEIAALLTHASSTTGAPPLTFLAAPDEFSGLLPIVRSMILATLEAGETRSAELTARMAAAGVAAQSSKVDSTDLMTACTRILVATERYVARARPDIDPDDDWKKHWATMNRVVCRAALFGHRRASFGSDSEWLAALHDPAAEHTIGLKVAAELLEKREADRVAAVTGTERAMVVEAIRAASSRIDSGEDAVIATDKSGTILYWNDAATTLYGWRSAEVLGRNVLDVTPASQSSADAERIMHQLLTGQAWSGRFTVKDKSGAPMQVLVTDIPVKQSGGVIGIVGLSAVSRGT